MIPDDYRKIVMLNYEPRLIAGFRRKALATDDEIQAWLIGEIWKNAGGTMCAEIIDLHYPKLVQQSESVVQAYADPTIKTIGSIHSHPNTTEWGASIHDHNGAVLDGEKIWGVYHFTPPRRDGRRLAKVDWFAPGRMVIANPE